MFIIYVLKTVGLRSKGVATGSHADSVLVLAKLILQAGSSPQLCVSHDF